MKTEQTTAEKLTTLLKTALPQRNVTGISNHLAHLIRVDPKSKGKAVLFGWKNTTYRLTANLKVYELDFTNSFCQSPEALEVEKRIREQDILNNPVETIMEKTEVVIPEQVTITA
jgi:hypothetical protein